MLKLKVRPIDTWPGERTKSPRNAPFRAGLDATLRLLEDEITAIHGRNIILQLDCNESDIHRDEMVRRSIRVKSAAVIFRLEYWKPTGKVNEQGRPLGVYTPLSFPCDTFNDWQDNLRAIALGMEALRKVDRYGITRGGEQYKGWLALPESGGLQSDAEAAATLMKFANLDCSTAEILMSPETAKLAYRAAASTTHPDTRFPGFTDADFGAVQTAWGRIKQRHKL